MASYQIILNLSGNAINRTERLAAALAKANAAASNLATSMAAVSGAASMGGAQFAAGRTAANALSVRPAGGHAYAQTAGYGYSQTGRYVFVPPHGGGRVIAGRSVAPSHAGGNAYMRWGTQWSMLGLSGYSGFRMAGSFARYANWAMALLSTLGKIGSMYIKHTAYATAIPVAATAMGFMGAMKLLQGEKMADATRLLSRRSMARMGLGEAYERAQTMADALSKSYGFDRAATISGINVLTGMGVGGGAKLSMQQAGQLTKIGGLISHHSGVPFERVMTNVQQLLAQAVPQVRDIRELIGQAPIMGKYALQEMEKRGIKGVDIREYYKDKGALLRAFQRYESENVTTPTMQARGQLALAQQDMYAKLASNYPVWEYVGRQGSQLYGALGDAANKALGYLTGNETVRVHVKNMEYILGNIENLTDTLVKTGKTGVGILDNFLVPLSKTYLALNKDMGNKEQAKIAVDKENTVAGGANFFESTLRAIWEGYGSSRTVVPEVTAKYYNNAGSEYDPKTGKYVGKNDEYWRQVRERDYFLGLREQEWQTFFDEFKKAAVGDKQVLESTRVIESELYERQWNLAKHARKVPEEYEKLRRPDVNHLQETIRLNVLEDQANLKSNLEAGSYIFKLQEPNPVHWAGINNAYRLELSPLVALLSEMMNAQRKSGDLNVGGGSSALNVGDDISGINNDKRSLTINFNDKLVEWNSVINSNNAQAVRDEIGGDLESLTARAIQIALLGATEKMNRF